MSAEAVPSEAERKPTRKELRDQLLGKKHEADSRVITLFGQKIELRQPNLKAVLDAAATEGDNRYRGILLLVEYAYVPETDEKVFEVADVDTMLLWPANKDWIALQMALADMTGIDISQAMEDLQASPLGGGSSNSAKS